MYIDPFVGGVVSTLFIEFILFFSWIVIRMNKKKYEDGMAVRKQIKKEEEYVPLGIPTKITALSRNSVKLKEDYYTFEAIEERTFPENATGIDLEKEWKAIFDSVNSIVDFQYNETLDAVFGKKKEEENKKKTTSKRK